MHFAELPLSERERQVLGDMPTTMTKQEIASGPKPDPALAASQGDWRLPEKADR